MKLVTVLMCIFLNVCFSEEVYQGSNYDQITEYMPETILFETEDRIYLMPEHIQFTPVGMYVGSVPINSLFSDQTGYWLMKAKSYWMCQNETCPNAGRAFYNSSGKCPYCRVKGLPG